MMMMISFIFILLFWMNVDGFVSITPITKVCWHQQGSSAASVVSPAIDRLVLLPASCCRMSNNCGIDDIFQFSQQPQIFFEEDNAYSSFTSLLLSSSSFLQGENVGGGAGNLIFPVVLTLAAVAVGAFLYANLFITPEIIEANEQMRMESRELEVQKLIALVQAHIQEGKDVEELRFPLEEAFGMTIEEYIVDVTTTTTKSTTKIPYANSDYDLAELLNTSMAKK